MIFGKTMRLTENERDCLDSLQVLYKDLLKDPDLLLDKRTGRMTLFEYHECTLKDFITHVKSHGNEKANWDVQIYTDKEDMPGNYVNFKRYYKLQELDISVSDTLDHLNLIPAVLEYFKEVKFEIDHCSVIDQILLEKEKRHEIKETEV